MTTLRFFLAAITMLLLVVSCVSAQGNCSSERCKEQACPQSDPFVCLRGTNAGGCAANPDHWRTKQVCSLWCNTVDCKKSQDEKKNVKL